MSVRSVFRHVWFGAAIAAVAVGVQPALAHTQPAAGWTPLPLTLDQAQVLIGGGTLAGVAGLTARRVSAAGSKRSATVDALLKTNFMDPCRWCRSTKVREVNAPWPGCRVDHVYGSPSDATHGRLKITLTEWVWLLGPRLEVVMWPALGDYPLSVPLSRADRKDLIEKIAGDDKTVDPNRTAAGVDERAAAIVARVNKQVR